MPNLKISYNEWLQTYNETISKIISPSSQTYFENTIEYYDNGQDPNWSALIYIQEHIKSFTFEEWTNYINFVLQLILKKNNDDIEDMPYYELWDTNTNPLIVALYVIFQTNQTFENLPLNAKEMWTKSQYNNDIKNQIEKILARYY